MGFFKNLFGKKKEIIEEDEEEYLEEPQEVYSVNPICEWCKDEIKPDHFCVTKVNKKFHKQCFRQVRRQAKSAAFN